MSQTEHSNAGYERTDVHVRPIVLFVIVLTVVSAAVLVGARWMSSAFEASAARKDTVLHPMAAPRALPPGPTLQANPSQELERYRAAQAALAEGYGWIDREAGIVRVPIERALELALEQGFPVRVP